MQRVKNNGMLTAANRENERQLLQQQINEFLRRGGKIEVLSGVRAQDKPMGSVWHENTNQGLFS